MYRTEELWHEAQGWRQDDMTVFVADPARTAVSWRIRFDSSERAAALAREIEGLYTVDLVVHTHGAEIPGWIVMMCLSGTRLPSFRT